MCGVAHHHGANREPFSSLGAALDARHYEGADQAKLKRVVDFLASKLGTVTEVSIAQRGNAIDVCFGGDEQVGLFIHHGYADVPPKHVEQLGGFALLVAACPGFIRAPGQRSNHARIPLSGNRRRH